MLVEYLHSAQFCKFLAYLANQHFAKASKDGIVNVSFGLSRATYVLHMFSWGEFPIYDANTHSGLHFLTQGHYLGEKISKMKTDDPDWYLHTFCRAIHDLQRNCDAKGPGAKRAIDRALFCYGKSMRRED